MEVHRHVILSNRQNRIHFFDIKFRCRPIRRHQQRLRRQSQVPDTAGFFLNFDSSKASNFRANLVIRLQKLQMRRQIIKVLFSFTNKIMLNPTSAHNTNLCLTCMLFAKKDA